MQKFKFEIFLQIIQLLSQFNPISIRVGGLGVFRTRIAQSAHLGLTSFCLHIFHYIVFTKYLAYFVQNLPHQCIHVERFFDICKNCIKQCLCYLIQIFLIIYCKSPKSPSICPTWHSSYQT